MKWSVSIAVVSSALAGCLFPSFDDLGDGGSTAPESNAGPKSDGGSTSPSADGGLGSTTPPSDQPAPTEGGASKIEVTCGGNTCDVATTECCIAFFSGAQCAAHSQAELCANGGGKGDLLRCDGPEDCAGGSVCCYVAADRIASCRPSCDGNKVLCHPGSTNQCNPSRQCTGNLTLGSTETVTYGYCQ
jgi:hypothetical protein